MKKFKIYLKNLVTGNEITLIAPSYIEALKKRTFFEGVGIYKATISEQ